MNQDARESRNEAVRIAKEWLSEPDKRASTKLAIEVQIGPKTAALIDDGAVMARYILSEIQRNEPLEQMREYCRKRCAEFHDDNYNAEQLAMQFMAQCDYLLSRMKS